MKLFISLAVATYVLIAGFTMGYLSPLYAERNCEFWNTSRTCGHFMAANAMVAGMFWPLSLPAELGRALAAPEPPARIEDETR